MPSYNSKSQKRSKNSKNSKSGGRRRKHTMRKYRRGKKVMRGGIINSWVRQNMNENEQGAFISLLYKAFPGIDTDEITNLSTQDEVAQAIHTKIQNMKLTPNEEDVLYTEFEHFFR